MPLLSRKGILAIAAVLDVALHAVERPVSAKELAGRQGLPPRHLEPVLQALVHEGILHGVRGPRGGYEPGRELKSITAVDILRAAGTTDQDEGLDFPPATHIRGVIIPALAQAERTFAAALGRITIEDLVRASRQTSQDLSHDAARD